jgi:hypothetical protein
MTNIQHKDIPEAQLHEVKGASTSTAGQILTSTGGASAWASAPTGLSVNQGFIDYSDAGTTSTPISLTANTWTTITNDGAGSFTNKTYAPESIPDLMDEVSAFDFSSLDLGTSVLIRNDFSVTPDTNNALLELRYQLGLGGAAYTLETILGRLDSGSGIPYRFSLRPDFIYMGDTNTRDNPGYLQIRLSSNGSVVNAGSVIQVIGR